MTIRGLCAIVYVITHKQYEGDNCKKNGWAKRYANRRQNIDGDVFWCNIVSIIIMISFPLAYLCDDFEDIKALFVHFVLVKQLTSSKWKNGQLLFHSLWNNGIKGGNLRCAISYTPK